jgi:hypothetical protein
MCIGSPWTLVYRQGPVSITHYKSSSYIYYGYDVFRTRCGVKSYQMLLLSPCWGERLGKRLVDLGKLKYAFVERFVIVTYSYHDPVIDSFYEAINKPVSLTLVIKKHFSYIRQKTLNSFCE